MEAGFVESGFLDREERRGFLVGEPDLVAAVVDGPRRLFWGSNLTK